MNTLGTYKHHYYPLATGYTITGDTHYTFHHLNSPAFTL